MHSNYSAHLALFRLKKSFAPKTRVIFQFDHKWQMVRVLHIIKWVFLRAVMFAVGRDRADRREAKHQHKDL